MKNVLLLAVVCLLCALLAGCNEGVERVTVSTALVKQADELSGVVWHGNIEALHTVAVSPGASGKVLEVLVSEGQYVKAGDTLFTLDSSDLELQLKQAQAAYHAAQVAAANAATAYRENTLVLPAQIARDDAEANYQRLQTLYEAAAIPAAELNAAKSRLETAQAQLNAAQINQKSAYENTQAQAATAQVAVEAAGKRVNDCTILAPSSGMVTKITAEPGAFASPQAPALTIIDDSALLVKIQVLETDIGQIAPGLAMDIAVQALGQTYAGTVDWIDTLANTKTGMIEVSVMLNKTAAPPRLGLTADVQISGLAKANAAYVPEAALLTENGLAYVFVVENSIVNKRQIEIVKKTNANLEVKGLQAGEEVVINSSAALSGGEQVNVLKWQN